MSPAQDIVATKASVNIKKETSLKAVEEQAEKHMFNWDLLNKGKYTVAEKKPKNGIDSPSSSATAALRKNAHLEALPYNPADLLSPVNEEEIKRKVSAKELAVNDQHGAFQKKTKILTKIDESLLTKAAKNVQQIISVTKSPTGVSKGQFKPPNLGAVGKLMPILKKLPSVKNGSN